MPRNTHNLVRLTEELQGTSEGLTLSEIGKRLLISESTARRLLEDASGYYGNVIEGQPDGRAKRWRMLPGTTSHLVAFTPEELAELDRAARRLRTEGITDGAAALEKLRGKLNLLT